MAISKTPRRGCFGPLLGTSSSLPVSPQILGDFSWAIRRRLRDFPSVAWTDDRRVVISCTSPHFACPFVPPRLRILSHLSDLGTIQKLRYFLAQGGPAMVQFPHAKHRHLPRRRHRWNRRLPPARLRNAGGRLRPHGQRCPPDWSLLGLRLGSTLGRRQGPSGGCPGGSHRQHSQ